jgi:ABC-2 type transport system ATP-binding protein
LKAKLGGFILTLQLTNGADITDLLREIQDVSELVKEGQSYKIKLLKTELAIQQIVEAVTKQGLKISDITLTKPTLDQVFLQITGNTMRDGAANSYSFGQPILIERLK